MITVTCPCGGEIEADSGYRDDDIKTVDSWLGRHQGCVQIGVTTQEQEMILAAKCFIKDNDGYGPATEPLYCLECQYVQPVGADSMHATSCSKYENDDGV